MVLPLQARMPGTAIENPSLLAFWFWGDGGGEYQHDPNESSAGSQTTEQHMTDRTDARMLTQISGSTRIILRNFRSLSQVGVLFINKY
ncbi:MAG: hypothetical protein K9M97_11630 [Akkermansiaceae bacterium]|nr:hypothetical protein [Akkermansiaceae bacterium]